jgi:hypothetical protein
MQLQCHTKDHIISFPLSSYRPTIYNNCQARHGPCSTYQQQMWEVKWRLRKNSLYNKMLFIYIYLYVRFLSFFIFRPISVFLSYLTKEATTGNALKALH